MSHLRPAQDRYVRREELAEIMGVSVRVIDQFRAEGMPCETWGLRAVRFSVPAALAWARARDRKEAA